MRWVFADQVDESTSAGLAAALAPYEEADPIAVTRVRYAAGLPVDGASLVRVARISLAVDADDAERFARAAIMRGYDRARLTLAEALAWVAAATGRLGTAAELLERAIDVSEHEQPALALHAGFDLARFGWSDVARQRVERIQPTGGWLAEQQRRFVLATSAEARGSVRRAFVDRGAVGSFSLTP